LPETRAIIVTLPKFLRDIITTLVEARLPLNIVADLDRRCDVAAALEVLAPDLVVVGLRAGETDDVGRSRTAGSIKVRSQINSKNMRLAEATSIGTTYGQQKGGVLRCTGDARRPPT
jgi:hypothetical protein